MVQIHRRTRAWEVIRGYESFSARDGSGSYLPWQGACDVMYAQLSARIETVCSVVLEVAPLGTPVPSETLNRQSSLITTTNQFSPPLIDKQPSGHSLPLSFHIVCSRGDCDRNTGEGLTGDNEFVLFDESIYIYILVGANNSKSYEIISSRSWLACFRGSWRR